MPRIKSIYIFFVVFLSIGSLCFQALASSSDDLKTQIDNYSLTLIKNPSDSKTQNLLLELSNQKNLQADQLLKLHRFEDLVDYNQKLRNKIHYFLVKIEEQKKLLIEHDVDMIRVNTELATFLSNDNTTHLEETTKMINELKEKDPLNALNTMLIAEKERLLTKVVLFQDQYQYLANIRDSKVITQAEPDIQVSRKGKTHYISDKKPKTANVDTSYKDELENVRMELDELYASLKEKDQKIQQLTSNLVKAELKSSEKDIQLKKQNEDIRILRQEFQNFESRFNLTQNMIQERDQTIEVLREDLKEALIRLSEADSSFSSEANVALQKEYDQLKDEYRNLQSRFLISEKTIEDQSKKIAKLEVDLRNSYAKNTVSSDETGEQLLIKDAELAQLNSVLVTYRKQLTDTQDTLDKRNSEVAFLNEELSKLKRAANDSKKEIRLSELRSKQQTKTIDMLKNTIDHLRGNKSKEGEYLRKAIEEKEKEVSQISNVLKIYKDKLASANQKLVDKDSDMAGLENQLRFAHKDLSLKNEIIQKARKDIALFSEQLIELQAEIANLKDAQTYNSEKNSGVANQILALQTKLTNIEDFLKKELKNSPNVQENITISETENLKKFPAVNVEVNQQ